MDCKQDSDILNELHFMASKGTLTGIFHDIPNDIYHMGPGISSTGIKPYYARLYDIDYQEPKNSSALKFGNAFHTYILEPDAFRLRYSVGFVAVDHREFVTPTEFDTIKKMAASLSSNQSAMALLKESKRELTCYSVCPQTGILQKARADILQVGDDLLRISDIKTTSELTQSGFIRSSKSYLYRVSAAFYIKVFSEIYGTRRSEFFLLACTKDSKYKTKVYEIESRTLENSDREVRETLEIIKRERESGPSVWDELDSQVKRIAI